MKPRPGAKIAVRYASALALSHVLAVAVALAVVVPLGWQLTEGAAPRTAAPLSVALLLVGAGTTFVAVAGVLNISNPLSWFVIGRSPDPAERRSAARLAIRQSVIIAIAWAASGLIFVAMNLDAGMAVAVPTLLGVALGGASAATIALLLTQATIRPIMIAAGQAGDGAVAVPGVRVRMVALWLLCCAIPCGTISALVGLRAAGVMPHSAPLEGPILVVALAALLVGLPAMMLTSQSISEPINEVVNAMARVQHGGTSESVDVYERSELGRLQRGFNLMVDGLAERDRVRDIFGHHVGTEVAQRAIDEGVTLSGDVQEVAVLFIDLVGSTTMAANHPPRYVAELLNRFFEIVVHAVDAHHGVINKFQGDAALAVFGAPLPSHDAESQALATARSLRHELRSLPAVDFGIGVSAGPVFAGNIGAEDRYEYTVIGDPVNEAARLADLAKTYPQRSLSSSTAVARASDDERPRWETLTSVILPGRSGTTQLCAAIDSDGSFRSD